MTRVKVFTIVWCFIGSLATAQNDQIPAEWLQGLEYRSVGPTRGGRVTAVTGIASREGTFFMGSTGGGLWKTDDYGQKWKNVSDGYFQSPSIGAVRAAPSDPGILYVGTGSDGIRSNVITGKGVYKSTDEGGTWQFMGLEKAGQIGAVEIHPNNPEVVFVAAIGQAFSANAERGVYRTRDGGANWQQVLFLSDSTGAVDLEFCPGNPDIIYASMWQVRRKPWTIISGGTEGGVYKSTDGGNSWNKLVNGLPDGVTGKSDLAVSPDDPNRLYVLIEAPVGKGGVYRSDDQGASFELVSTKKELLDRPFYYCNIDANPLNANSIYVSATGFYWSSDAGKSWKRRRTPHGDNHDLWISPSDTLLMIQANDGGANVSRDGGLTWSTQENQPTAELYQVEVDDQFPYWLYAGQQDNTTIALPSLPPYNSISGEQGFWREVGGCETGPAVPKPGNHHVVYSNCKGRFGVFNKKTGQEKQYYVGAANMYGHNPRDLTFRFQRVAPIHVSPHDPNLVYHASQYLHRTQDDGRSWEIISPDLTAFTPETQVISGSPVTRDITGEEFYSTIYAVRESPLQPGLIWVGANDGPVQVTRDGGQHWSLVTPAGLPPGGRVQCIEPSAHRAGKAYIAVYRYLLGDWQPYVFRTENFGKSWKRLTDGTNGIPSGVPTRVIREDPEQEGLLYCGTEFGMYVSFNDGKNWQPLQRNLPLTPVTDIKITMDDLVLSTMGRGFWILDNINPLREVNKKIVRKRAYLFQPRDSYRLRYRTRGTDYPEPGAIVDYYLPEAAGKLRMEVWKGDLLLKTFITAQQKNQDETEEDTDMATGFSAPGQEATLANGPGAHRFRWNLRHQGAWDKKSKAPGPDGPMVSPGTYQIRLIADEQELQRSFSVLIDPRLEQAGVTVKDLTDQESLALKIRDLLTEARQLAAKIDSKSTSANDQPGRELRDALVTAEGRYQQPMLIDQIQYLYRMLDQADQRPGQDAYDRYEELKTSYLKLIPDTEKFSDQ